VSETIDSPTAWVRKHTEAYLASDGERGHDFHGYPSLLLTTRGRRSGQLRRTPLIYGRDGDRFVVVGSNGAAANHPNWYHNLLADPAVTVQVKAEVFAGTAHPAGPDERERLWKLMAEIFPRYEQYAQQTTREIPVVVIERTA
jgi:deazaflavin-dependent oxidoreductase (nitroreductase family)